VVTAEVTPLEKEMNGAKAGYEKKLSDAAQVVTAEVIHVEKEVTFEVTPEESIKETAQPSKRQKKLL
jgi:hypothetical protein